MEKFKYLQKIKEIYARGENIIQYLKQVGKNQMNSIEDILISYDFQSGSYIKEFSNNSDFRFTYCGALAKVIDQLGSFESIMEVGVGEATTLSIVLNQLKNKPKDILGFDISWSRLKFAQAFIKDYLKHDIQLFTANLFEIPLKDNAVEVVYTSHSIEPNGGKEKEALEELYRITGKYLVLLEPSYEFGSEEARQRMNRHGYVTALYETAKSLGYTILEHRLFGHAVNPLNPTGLIIIEKKQVSEANAPQLVCPIAHTPLEKHSDYLLFSKDSFLAYPVIEGIPCLLKDNAILATHLKTDFQEFKRENGIEF